VFLEPAFVLLVRVEIVEDDVKLVVREWGYTLFMKPRNSTRRRRFECDAMIFPVATLECCKQGRRAVPLVVIALAG
jgi:hypothetical protein